MMVEDKKFKVRDVYVENESYAVSKASIDITTSVSRGVVMDGIDEMLRSFNKKKHRAVRFSPAGGWEPTQEGFTLHFEINPAGLGAESVDGYSDEDRFWNYIAPYLSILFKKASNSDLRTSLAS